MKKNTKVLGSKGEVLASQILKEKGYQIVATNFSNHLGEIDVIAKQEDTLVFVEVKTRSSYKFGLPSQAVTFQKQNKIRTVALSYLKATKNLETQCRFDVIEIVGKEYRHIENAF